ncbi:hypothetical protein LK09_00425 [Microbacterium mangrovi]|uniref:Spore protein YkvP/CgeB glycosyl transferase-like domain-containing protein n=1 Tax=Microbacterium mangrovi TaxID=1348253 RepID=A0A0B2A9L9_9MICO|nr:glycosyltransferase [Microbacterium mangrovi]KHK99844.1 hypothetical protein LK09_00425 [Microbacterium mangrovi]
MKVLLVSPVFHGYWHAIAAALAAHGHVVTTHRYDGGDAGRRLRNAVAHRVPVARPRAARLTTQSAIAALEAVRPDAVLVVKGDVLGSAWWDALTRSRARTALWLYDELERMNHAPAVLRAVETVYSYSPRDVEALRRAGVPARFLPDGYDSLTDFRVRPSGAITFVGARYAAREQSLAMLAARGIPVAAYGREWSRYPWDVIRTGRLRSAGVPSHRDLSRAEYYGVMAGSLATLNVHGDGHDGLSMRTFEASGVGALQLIDRTDAAEFYEPGRELLVFHSDAELVDHIQRARRDPVWATGIRTAGRRRTMARHTLVHRMGEVQEAWL